MRERRLREGFQTLDFRIRVRKKEKAKAKEGEREMAVFFARARKWENGKRTGFCLLGTTVERAGVCDVRFRKL